MRGIEGNFNQLIRPSAELAIEHTELLRDDGTCVGAACVDKANNRRLSSHVLEGEARAILVDKTGRWHGCAYLDRRELLIERIGLRRSRPDQEARKGKGAC